MNRFAALLDRLAYDSRRNAKIALMADYFRDTPDPARGLALAALTGDLSFRNAKPGAIRALIEERTDPVLFRLSYDYVGDLSETVALMWPAPEGGAEDGLGPGAFGARSRPRSGATAPRRSDLGLARSALETQRVSPAGADRASPPPRPSPTRGEGEPRRAGSVSPPSAETVATPSEISAAPAAVAPSPLVGEGRGGGTLARPGNPPPLTLPEVVAALESTGRAGLPTLLAGLLDRLDETGRWALLKLITGGLRVGVSARLAKTAVASLGDLEPADIEEVWHGLAPPYEALFAWAEGRAGRPDITDPVPFRPAMLSHAIEEGDFDTLDAAAFSAEWKWDGIRVQAVAARDSETGDISARRLYSRTGDDISAAFPDLTEALTFDGAIDGELLILRAGRVQSFNALQQRLNRKTVTAKMMASHPAHLIAYDLLVADGEDLRDMPLAERRVRLEAFIATAGQDRLSVSPLIDFTTWEDLAAARADPPAHGADADAVEGVMIKRLESPYLAGRPKGHWWKWKRDPFNVDAVLMYAQRGHGKRSSFYSDYTFGVWREAERGLELVPVGKAYFGFTDEELRQLDRFVRQNTINRFGPVREVTHEPETGLVLEIAFEGLARSTRHKSGLAMRFPRIGRIRWDKRPADADRIEALLVLLKDD